MGKMNHRKHKKQYEKHIIKNITKLSPALYSTVVLQFGKDVNVETVSNVIQLASQSLHKDVGLIALPDNTFMEEASVEILIQFKNILDEYIGGLK